MAALVRETADGQFEVVDGDDGDDVLATFDLQTDALDDALERNGGKTKPARLHDYETKEPNGVWRWLHALDVEDEPVGGARIDEQTVDEAIASLNNSPRAEPINGGLPDSPAHGPSGDTLATGYAHHAVKTIAADGRVGGYVIAELLPEVDVNVGTGRIASDSIGLSGTVAEEGGPIRDAEFDHLALTGKNAVGTLKPNAAIRAGERFVAVRSHRLSSRTKGKPMPVTKTSVRAEIVKPLNLRGVALDALTVLCKSLGVELDTELTSDEWSSPAKAALCALREMAKAERLVESLTGAQQASARSAVRAVIAPTLQLRAEIDDAKWGELAKALGLEASASIDDAIAAAGKLKPADDADNTDEGDMTTEKDKAAAEAKDAARSQKITSLEAEVAGLRAESEARKDAEWLDAEIAKRGATVSSETRSKFERALRADRKDGRELVAGLIADLPVAPAAVRKLSSGGGKEIVSGAPVEVDRARFDALVESKVATLRAADAESPKHHLVARAQKLVRAEHPEFRAA